MKKLTIPVTVIAQEGEQVLVQWTGKDNLFRAGLPAEKVVEGQVVQADLEAGIPYGVEWDEEFPGLCRLTYEMRRRGIWTFDDARSNISKAREAVITSTGEIIRKLLEGG